MERSFGHRTAAALLAAVVLTACSAPTRETGPPAVRPDARGEAMGLPADGLRADTVRPVYTEADVRFMQHMIVHHAQALEMTDLVPARTQREDIRLLAERLEVSQRDEVALMRSWLEERGQEVPGPHAHHQAGGEHAHMPGMLSPEQLARLAAARGPEFDRLFLELMIHHHEGALVMVEELFASEGAAQETDIYRIASEIDADQRMEIERMRRLLAALPAGMHHH